MRSFNKMRATFWGSGETGRLLRPYPEFTKLLAIWMFTNEKALAEPWGLYHCSVPSIVEGLGGTTAKVTAGLGVLAELQFAAYDPSTEWLWVVNMAAEQVLSDDKRPLSPKDHMSTAANKWYARCPRNPFLGPYFDRYATLLHLDARRDGGMPVPLAGPKAQIEGDVVQPLLLTGPTPLPKRTSPADQRLGEFDLFWAAYHQKGKSSKVKAREEWMKRKPPALQVMAGLERWKTSQRWQDGFVVDASRFLKEERWLETPEQALAPGMSERTRDVVAAMQGEGGSIFDYLPEETPRRLLKEG